MLEQYFKARQNNVLLEQTNTEYLVKGAWGLAGLSITHEQEEKSLKINYSDRTC